MSSNKKAKEDLIKHYGAECFIEKLHLRPPEPKHYTGAKQKAKMKQLTYHHIRMKKDGGRATRENGALLSNENHIWFHKQTKLNQEQMNSAFQEYKKRVDNECEVVFVDELESDLGIEINGMIFEIDEKGKIIYNRAKEKRKLQEAMKEYYDDCEEHNDR